MTNKEFQNLLSQYLDDYNILVNWAFDWEVPSNKYKEDPYIYVNDDCGFIEIEPKEYRDIWIKCSERLPELHEQCLVKYGDSVCMSYYDEDRLFRWCEDGCDSTEYYDFDDIEEWMPIPESFTDTY